jgi:hypothetical protein
MDKVLCAVIDHTTLITPPTAAILGTPIVTEAEVNNTMKTSKPGTAPGIDCIPLGLYIKFLIILFPCLHVCFL